MVYIFGDNNSVLPQVCKDLKLMLRSFILLSGDIHFVYYTPINIRSVIVRDLSFNELYGDIPFSVSKLKQLEHLYDSERKEVSMASIGSGMSSTTNTGTRSMYIDRVTLSYITLT
ncbi:Replication protein A 70 kDa DNA-binding subunit B [Camellia lanceoleosa]|uniref:Replication protein A 70 kDa DNA-binding subunit B n=1 Tax=Camellia lanceoleosa TaxID=1840588 RepID=A0ACC0GWR0_9ERIC|nr:Replication protein A 70 kDa DNA-binding subunit B [Camellia lanceoleosa]